MVIGDEVRLLCLFTTILKKNTLLLEIMETELEGRVREAFSQDRVSREEQRRIFGLLENLNGHPPTKEHCFRVCLKAREIAAFFYRPTKHVARGGALHDIGKVRIPLEILKKSEFYDEENPYTPEDHELMKEHTKAGFEILTSEGFFMSAWIALTHHHFQKNAYPLKLPPYTPELISTREYLTANTNSRIVSIADQWDASSRRNNLHTSQSPTSDKIKENLIQGNLDWVEQIEHLYSAGILF